MSQKIAQESPLQSLNRFITTHDESTGKSVFSNAVLEQNPTQVVPGVVFRQGYVTKKFPVQLNGDEDLDAYQSFLKSPPGLVNSSGTVLRIVDLPPQSTSPMHRTVSLDYGIVLIGEVDLLLDSGEVRTMRPGDMAIQRGTMHAWVNKNPTEWARIAFVLQPSEPVVVGGKKLEEDYADMEGVKKSE
ncbi:cupin domain-containing protein [Karstenula rhodostoma CBS 690.94]|uniref:Cupin domain-containing protein n=1 Tax=Karstenula rhodostoma CBS 690.94 TaxID=1392251 RepID=A0A9P4UDF6_9PLEO|nr:cupin domain-containing protein [Karstenula rhodostoma CBS 690.94]